MYFETNSYGLSPYMYDDPYTILQRAQLGIQTVDEFQGTPVAGQTFPYQEEPQSGNYRSYRDFKDAYDRWVIENSNFGVIPNQQDQGVVLNQDQPASVSSGPTVFTSSYKGPSVVDFLSSTGKSSDYNTRKQIAKVLGIQNYRGTPNQNKLMINLISQNPGVLNAIVSSSSRKKPANKKVSPLNDNNLYNKESDSTGVNIPIVDSSGNIIDTTSGKTLTTLPKPTDKKLPGKKTTGEQEGLSDLEKAIAAVSATALVGGAGYAGVLEAKDIIANTYKLTGNNLKIYNDVVRKKLMPKVRGSVKAWENLGKDGQEAYNILQNLVDEGLSEARRYRDMTPDERVTYDLLQEQKNIAKGTRGQKSMMRTVQKYAPKGTPKLTVPNTPKALPKATAAPKALPKVTRSSYTQAFDEFGNMMGRASNYIKSSKPYQKASGYLDEISNTARNLRNSKGFQTAGNILKKFRFEEGGEQQNQMMQQIVGLISQELQQNKSPYEIAQTLMTYGISQDDALKLIDQVTMEMSQYMQPNMAGAPQGDEQGYMSADAGEEAEQQMMMAYGGGYSGTYDQGSGSYFQMGGSFVPTYGDILPQYMYGSDYDNDLSMYSNESYMQDGGSLNIGDTLDVSPEELEYLRQQGYDFDIV